MTIIGAGLLGLASAWALQEKGFAVEVIEAESAPGLGTSFANSGMLTPSMADPWNSPGILFRVLRWLGRENAPMLLRPSALPVYFYWGLQFLRNSRRDRHEHATRANFALASASMEEFSALQRELGLQYDQAAKGTLQVFRFPGEFRAAQGVTARLQPHGLRARVLGEKELVQVEPSLGSSHAPLVGGILYENDQTGDAHLFCQAMEKVLSRRGVIVHYGRKVSGIERMEGNKYVLKTNEHDYRARRLVIAAASASVGLARVLGLALPVRPVKGYSLTASCSEVPELLPQRAIIDSHLHGAITPLGSRLRLAGTAELAGWSTRLHHSRLENLWSMLGIIMPQLQENLSRAELEPWAGLRPMSADGLPFIGSTHLHNVFLNTGHGHLGWTQSLGSGRLLADLMAGDRPVLDATPYRATR